MQTNWTVSIFKGTRTKQCQANSAQSVHEEEGHAVARGAEVVEVPDAKTALVALLAAQLRYRIATGDAQARETPTA